MSGHEGLQYVQKDEHYRTNLYIPRINGDTNSTDNAIVYPENCTSVTEVLLAGFKAFKGFRMPMFVLLFIIYLLICCENVLIIYIIFSSSRLKALMFLIIQSMCVADLLCITNIIPKQLGDILSERPSVAITGCIVQLHIYGIYGNIGSFHYAIMSYDRYLAVCHPLRYSSFVNTKIYLQAILTFWITSIALQSTQSWFYVHIQFCGHNTIRQFFCDFFPFVELATSDTSTLRIFAYVVSAFMLLMTFHSVIITYMFILHTILKIPSTNGRKKTFSTCSSHLIVFSLQNFISFSIYLMPPQIVTIQLSHAFTFIHFFWTPLVNPLIYTFNSSEFRVECRKNFEKVHRIFENDHI